MCVSHQAGILPTGCSGHPGGGSQQRCMGSTRWMSLSALPLLQGMCSLSLCVNHRNTSSTTTLSVFLCLISLERTHDTFGNAARRRSKQYYSKIRDIVTNREIHSAVALINMHGLKKKFAGTQSLFSYRWKCGSIHISPCREIVSISTHQYKDKGGMLDFLAASQGHSQGLFVSLMLIQTV